MARTEAVSVRVDARVKRALEQAAKEDARSIAQYVEVLIIENLTNRGLLSSAEVEGMIPKVTLNHRTIGGGNDLR
jgi:hypothetical protein